MVVFLSPVMILGAGELELTHISTTSNTSNTISISGVGMAAGDFCIIINTLHDGSPVPGAPSGFTTVKESSGGDGGIGVYYKVLSGSETTITSGASGVTSGQQALFAIIYRCGRSITTVTPSTWNGEATNLNPTSQSVDPTAVTTPVIVLGAAVSQSSAFNFSTASPAFDATASATWVSNSATRAACIGRKLYNSSPSSHTIDIVDEGNSNVLVSGYLAIS